MKSVCVAATVALAAVMGAVAQDVVDPCACNSMDDYKKVVDNAASTCTTANCVGFQSADPEGSLSVSNTKLTDLNISGSLNEIIFTSPMAALTSLNLNGNSLNTISMDNLGALKSLILSNNALSSFPNAAQPNLVSLDLSNNQLSSVTLSSYTGLKTVDLSTNLIKTLARSDLPAGITSVALGNNCFTSKPCTALTGITTCTDTLFAAGCTTANPTTPYPSKQPTSRSDSVSVAASSLLLAVVAAARAALF